MKHNIFVFESSAYNSPEYGDEKVLKLVYYAKTFLIIKTETIHELFLFTFKPKHMCKMFFILKSFDLEHSTFGFYFQLSDIIYDCVRPVFPLQCVRTGKGSNLILTKQSTVMH